MSSETGIVHILVLSISISMNVTQKRLSCVHKEPIQLQSVHCSAICHGEKTIMMPREKTNPEATHKEISR